MKCAVMRAHAQQTARPVWTHRGSAALVSGTWPSQLRREPKDDPWQLTTAPGSSLYEMWADSESDPPTLVCQVGSTQLKYHLSAIEDLHAWLLPRHIRHLLGDSFILTVDAGSGHPFRLAGTRVCALFGRELKDEPFTPLWSALNRPVVDGILDVLAGRVRRGRRRRPRRK